MIAMGTVTRLTIEQFLELPEKPGKQEFLNGELIELPPAKLKHNEIAKEIFLWLLGFLHPTRVWIETGYRMRAGWLVPDVSVTWPDQPVENGWLQGAPMIAIEVVSPSNDPEQLDAKTAAYLEDGAAEVWIVYPKTHSMMVFSEGGKQAARITGTYQSDRLELAADVRSLTR